MNPRVTDNDQGEITVSLNGKELRGWSYVSDIERRQKLLMAHEYVEGWCDSQTECGDLRSQLDEANEKLNLANAGGLTLLYDIRRALGWNEKTSLSILADGVRRVRHALETWDTPTGMDLEALAVAVKGRVAELEQISAERFTRIQELLEAQDNAPI